MAELRKLKSNLKKIEFENVLGEPVELIYNPGDLVFRENCGKLYRFAKTEISKAAEKERDIESKIKAAESEEEKLLLQLENSTAAKEFCAAMENEIDNLLGDGTSKKAFCGYKDPITYSDFIDMLSSYSEQDTKSATQKYAKQSSNKKK